MRLSTLPELKLYRQCFKKSSSD